MIRILVVEDSPVVREFLVAILAAVPDLEVVGTARDGEEALVAVQRLRPDVITMDIHMPKLNGLEATRRIMQTDPTPIIVVSGSDNREEVWTTFDAIEAGALAVLRRPAGIGDPAHAATARELVRTVRAMADVKVVRRWPRSQREDPRPVPGLLAARMLQPRIVAIGASTGGPPVLQTILAALPSGFPVPIAIVQHMAAGFIHGFGEWLGQSCALPVRLAEHGEPLAAGQVYLAPDARHMKITPRGSIALTEDPPEHGLRPSVSCLFRSVAESFGADAVAGLLSGMGSDGAAELHALKLKGALTFAQDRDSSVVHGMPGEAIRLDAAMLVLAPKRIAAVLASLANGDIAQWGKP